MNTAKRVLKIVKEKSTYETGKYLKELESKMGFPIRMIQVDNGTEFVNDGNRTERESEFEKMAKALNMELRRTRPYSPWQNGKVERSHREDGKILYNNTAKTVLNFKSPNKIVSEYFSNCNICLDN